MLDAQWSLPQIQECIYTYQRGNLPNCCWWMKIGELEGEFAVDRLEMRDRIPVHLGPPKGEHRHQESLSESWHQC